MSVLEQLKRHIPDPYPYMYKDGYAPYEILESTSHKMYGDYQARKEAAEQEVFIPTINFKTTVKIK